MTETPPGISEQLQRLLQTRQRCLDARAEFDAIRGELQQLTDDAERAEAAARQASDSRRKMQRERMASVLRQDLEALTQQFESDQQRLQQELDSELATAGSQRDAAVEELQRRLESELWVLQSVCDETSDDSPVGRLERARETWETQRQMLEERFRVLAENTSSTQTFLESCHAAPDTELPPPNRSPSGGEAARQQAVEEIERAVGHIASIGRMRLPHVVYGWRLLLLSALAFLVVFVIATAVRADLRSFLQSTIPPEDLRWAGISAVISLLVSGFVAFVLLLAAQHQLRQRFADVLQHTANARLSEQHWQKRAQAALRKQESAAEAWKQQTLADRERRIQRMREATDERIAAIDADHARRVADLESRTQQVLAERQREYRTQAAEREAAFERDVAAEDRQQRDALKEQLTSAAAQRDQRHSELTDRRQELIAAWKSDVDRLNQLVRASREAAAASGRWPHAAGSRWSVPTALPPAITAGDLLATIPSVSRASDEELVNTSIDVPALLRFPQDLAVTVTHDSAGRDPALEFVRAILLRLLTSVPPGRLQFTLIDPVGLGQSFSALMHLADYDELLISHRIWTDSTQIREQLQKVTEHMENVFQTYLRSEFETIEEYNAAAGEVAEPYHFVVVAGFPTGFSEESARHLTSVLTSGPRCGVYALVLLQDGQPLPRNFDADDLRHHSLAFQAAQGRVCPVADGTAIDATSGVEFESLLPPSPAEAVQLVRMIGEHSRDARRVEVSFARISPRRDDVWSQTTAEGIDLPIGRSGAARLQYLRLGRGTSQHVLIAGKTGSGKSTLLHILITNLALHYSPQEVQFYLIDFKKGVEFRTYAANHLPHARVIAIESDREFGLSVLERLDAILQERGELFRSRGVQDVPAFRRQFAGEPMPRLMLLIDEFQEFFVAEDRVSSRAALLLDRLIRQGRAFGIHVLLGSQTLGGAYSLARSTLGQVAVRIALQCSESDAHLILSEDNSAARLLSRPGEAIYNDANGLLEGNHPFQIAWLDEELRESVIADLRSRRVTPSPDETRMVVFEGNVPPSVDLCPDLLNWLTQPAESESESATIWLGEPVAIAPTTRIELRRAGGQNLLIVGQESEMADALLLMAALCGSVAAVPTAEHTDTPPAVCLLHDGRDRDSLTRLQQATGDDRLPGCEFAVGNQADELITRLHADLESRESGSGEFPSRLLIIRNIGQFRSLRKEEDEFSFGSYGEEKPVTAASRLGDLIKRGPLVGLHTVIWSDSYSNAVRWLTTSLLREFENRIAFRMNATDSASLVDSPVAAAMTPGRAILYRDQTGAIEKFRPFSWPSPVWLDSISHDRTGSDRIGDQDIDSLIIE